MSDAQNLLKLANACVGKSDFAGAVKHLTEAVNIAPDNKDLRANRAFAWSALGRHDEALTDAKHCIAIAPTFSKGYLRAGRALIAVGRIEDAATLLEDATEKMPQDYALQEALEDALAKLAAPPPAGGAASTSIGPGPAAADGGGGGSSSSSSKAGEGGLASSYYYAAVPASERKLPVAAPQRIDPASAAAAAAVANGHVREDIDKKGKHARRRCFMRHKNTKHGPSLYSPMLTELVVPILRPCVQALTHTITRTTGRRTLRCPQSPKSSTQTAA